MNISTIDREEAIACFRRLFESASSRRILRLLGEAKMGKTHLLTKVFRMIAEEHAAYCAVLDLRNPQQTIITHLHNACGQIGHSHFPTFDRTHTDWINRPQVQMTDLWAIFSRVSVRSRRQDDPNGLILRLTRCFVDDLTQLHDRTVVLIFDQVDDAAPETQTWLMHILLVQLQGLAHVRVVVGGRTLPEASGSYVMLCGDYELTPVHTESAYIDYCQEVGATLNEQSIRDVAQALHHAPGAFAEAVRTYFMPGDAPHG